MLQVPRLYSLYRKAKHIKNFQDMLENIFMPLFEVTQNPKSDPALHYFLETIVGIDSVDDESRPEQKSLAAGPGGLPAPDQWNHAENPPYGYWMYYMYVLLCCHLLSVLVFVSPSHTHINPVFFIRSLLPPLPLTKSK